MDDINMILWNELKKHRGHNVRIVSYGNWEDPANICLECEDCGEVVLDAEIYETKQSTPSIGATAPHGRG